MHLAWASGTASMSPPSCPGVSGALRADLMLEAQAPPLTGQDTSASVPVQAWGPSWEPGRDRAPVPATWPRVHLGRVLYHVVCEVPVCPVRSRSPDSSGRERRGPGDGVRERPGAVVPRSPRLVLLATECASGSRVQTFQRTDPTSRCEAHCLGQKTQLPPACPRGPGRAASGPPSPTAAGLAHQNVPETSERRVPLIDKRDR